MSYLMGFVLVDGLVGEWIVLSPLCSLTFSKFKFLKEFYGMENLRLSYIQDYEFFPYDLCFED